MFPRRLITPNHICTRISWKCLFGSKLIKKEAFRVYFSQTLIHQIELVARKIKCSRECLEPREMANWVNHSLHMCENLSLNSQNPHKIWIHIVWAYVKGRSSLKTQGSTTQLHSRDETISNMVKSEDHHLRLLTSTDLYTHTHIHIIHIPTK